MKILASAHASLAAYLKFKDSPEIMEWISGPFYKIICRVNDKEFEKAKKYPDQIVLTESALDNKEVAIAFKPRSEWSRFFKYLRMYR